MSIVCCLRGDNVSFWAGLDAADAITKVREFRQFGFQTFSLKLILSLINYFNQFSW